MSEQSLDLSEQIAFRLRALYEQQGYRRYKMSKFEEYDLYARNRDFLISGRVITFTGADGKLLALKPDVTLSIVKNSRPGSGVQKLCYNENVYRASGSTQSFKEIMQVGLECLGDIDEYCICEVLELAAESLGCIREGSILSISHLGFLSRLAEDLGIPESKKSAVLRCIGEKNPHELAEQCRSAGVSEQSISLLTQICAACGAPETVLPQIKALLAGITDLSPLERLEEMIAALDTKTTLRIDFSVVDDIRYYNGIVFKGFVPGLPGSILSGGQYDTLMRKMNHGGGAIGFAIYLDLLERLETAPRYDVDTLLLYPEGTSLSDLRRCVKALRADGSSVMAQRQKPEGIRFRRLVKLQNGEVKLLENDA